MNKNYKKKYVLVLPSWYPSRVNRFNGDFNERLVHAMCVECEQVVVYVVKDSSITKVEVVISTDTNVTTYRVYYPTTNVVWFRKIHSLWQYVRLSKKCIDEVIAEKGPPLMIHCYVFLNSMLPALYVKRRFSIPIVITEHWSAFYKESMKSLLSAGYLTRALYKNLIRSADHIIPVAERLRKEIESWAPHMPQTVIPNVVNTSLFNFAMRTETEPFKFLHVSTMKHAKNTDGLLRAFENAVRQGVRAELCLVGQLPAPIAGQISNSDILMSHVKVLGELEYPQVAQVMRSSKCLVMFSRYESLPCVILEALCCGLPVIATDVGGIKEVVTDDNGLIVSSEDESACTMAIIQMTMIYKHFDQELISVKAASQFSYAVVATKVARVYSLC